MNTSDTIIRNDLKKLIKKFHKIYGPKLSKYYGKSEFYSTGQIKRIVTEYNIRDEHIPYIYAYYLNQNDYDRISEELSIEYPYEYLRGTIEDVAQELNRVGKMKLLNIKESGIY